jgi:hypothetical protein
VRRALLRRPEGSPALPPGDIKAPEQVPAAIDLVYEDAPNPASFVGYAELNPGEVKLLTLSDVVLAWQVNERKVVLKGRLINLSLVVAGIGIVVALIARAV